MQRKSPTSGKTEKAPNREDRLKAALKSNMARRKAQAKARALTGNAGGGENKSEN